MSNWSTPTASVNPWDCECSLKSGSSLAGHIAPGVTGIDHEGKNGSFSARSEYNVFKYVLSLAWNKLINEML